MKVTFYGTRGSIPVCEPGFREFGGNTTCIRVTFANGRITILDAGSGLRNLGKDLEKEGHEQYDNIIISFSHFHWDHIQGLPFFHPFYDPNRTLTLNAMGANREVEDVQKIFQTQTQKEYFPIPIDQMGAEIQYAPPAQRTLIEEDASITAMPHNHPGGAYSFRIEENGRSFVFCTDVEHGDSLDQRVVRLAEGADLLIHEAQYTPKELLHKRGWGHSSWEQAIQVAELAQVGRLILTHHDPDHDDACLRKIERACQKRFPNCLLAREQMTVEV